MAESTKRRPAACWAEWDAKNRERRGARPACKPAKTTEPASPRSPADSRYWHARQQWMGRLGNTGRKLSEVSDDELIREAREWVDWRWSEYRQFRAAMASGDPEAMDECMGITQIEPPDSPRKNCEAEYQALVDAVAARQTAS